ncbi:HTH-type transcriptional repressor of iron proteins A [compost metagenome]
MITTANSYPRGTRLGLHVHREAQLLFASSGVMQVSTPKGRWLVPPARAVWLPPGIEHAVDMLADIQMRTLLIPSEQLAQHPEAPRLTTEFVVAVGPLLRETILAAFKPDAHPQRKTVLMQLALFELAKDEDGATFMPMPNDPRARRVADLILADPANNNELELLAYSTGASARTITRLFPAETNLTFKEWRQRARIMAAVEALSNGPTSIKQLSLQLGFSSVAAFGHAFRQIMGMTPSEMMRGSNASADAS